MSTSAVKSDKSTNNLTHLLYFAKVIKNLLVNLICANAKTSLKILYSRIIIMKFQNAKSFFFKIKFYYFLNFTFVSVEQERTAQFLDSNLTITYHKYKSSLYVKV